MEKFKTLEIGQKGTGPPSFTCGVLLPGYNLVYEAMLQGINETARRDRWLPLLSFSDENPILADRIVDQMVAKQVDGFIVVSIGMMQIFDDASRLEEFPPIVFVDAPDMPGYRVLCDAVGASRLSTEHLIEHGHTQIGMITAPLDWPNVAECYQGYRQTLAEYGLEHKVEWVVETEDFMVESGYEAGLALFNREEKPEAVFVAGDSLAVGVLRALSELGLSVPADVAVTSYNDSPYAEMVHPKLTSSSFPAYQMGKAAAELLYQATSGQTAGQEQIVLESTLAIRQSCGC